MKRWLLVLCLVLGTFGAFAQEEETTTCEAGYRLIEHALGETCVPENPQRIIPLDLVIFDLLMEMGVPPVGVPEIVLSTYLDMHPDLEEIVNQFEGELTDIGFPPNVEKVLSVEPDLIISPHDFFSEILYPQLSEVAPTVLFEPIPGDWAARLVFAGEVFGQSERVDELLAEYDARLELLKEYLPENADEITISLIRVLPGQMGMVISASAGDALIRQAGLARPEAQDYDYDVVLNEMNGWPEIRFSMEELLLADGDYIFIFGQPDELTSNPLWQSLSAVQNGRAFEVGYYWWGDSLYSAHKMLDDLFVYVAGVDLEEVEARLQADAETDAETDVETETETDTEDTE